MQKKYNLIVNKPTFDNSTREQTESEMKHYRATLLRKDFR